jgi:hypothetical protein
MWWIVARFIFEIGTTMSGIANVVWQRKQATMLDGRGIALGVAKPYCRLGVDNFIISALIEWMVVISA